MSSTANAIAKVESVINTIKELNSNAETPVEQVDLADIESDLRNVLEKLEALQAYQNASDTDYSELWEVRKRELKEFAESRDAWMRTEIFTMLLKSAQ